MNNSISIIGGADGPTSIFLGGSLGISWLNIFGLILVVLLLVPNIIYAVKEKNQENKCTNKLMNLVEQIGRYASMFLMVFNIGLAEVGFSSVGAFIVYMLGNILLMISYCDKFTDRIAYYNAFDEYHVKHNLSAMENLFAGYVNARLDMYLDMLQD